MNKPVKKPNDNLWACHRCKLIGDATEATRHLEQSGHEVTECTAEESAGVREIWREEGRSEWGDYRSVSVAGVACLRLQERHKRGGVDASSN